MDKREAVGLLQRELDELKSLRIMHYDNDGDNKEFKLLRCRMQDITENIFGKDSLEYRRIPIMPINTLTFKKTEEERKQEYNENLDGYEVYLKSIIQKIELVGIRAKPTVKAKPIGTLWKWLKSHKILSITGTVTIAVITLLGTNWATVWDNITKLLRLFR